jgi:peptidase E
MKLLLISNSTNAGEEYLRYPLPEIGRFLDGVREIVFVPYAAVTFSYADYEKKVQARFAELGIRVPRTPPPSSAGPKRSASGAATRSPWPKRCSSRGL